jgi:putative ubiquitin-RnfH superfamily antitoxin RatB of RatAB toxin-antitoxin module
MDDNNSAQENLSVSVTYADPENPLWLKVKVPAGSTVEDAIRASDLLTRYPDMDLPSFKIGIFGKTTELDSTLSDGDRVELYRPIMVDPKTVPRRKKKEKGE